MVYGESLSIFKWMFGRQAQKQEGQTTREQSRTLQVIGGGNGSPLARNGEGEEIVYARSERKWLLS